MIKEEILSMLDNQVLSEGTNWKNQTLSALKKAISSLSDAADCAKGISYYQKSSGVEYREDGNYSEKENAALKKYKEENDAYRNQRVSQGVEKLDHEIYEILDKLRNMQERVSKI